MTHQCKRCGTPNSPINTFCGSCGMKIASKSSNLILWLLGGGAIVGVLLIAGVLAVLYSIGKEVSSSEQKPSSVPSAPSATSPNTLSRRQFGDSWPLRVEEGVVACDGMAVTFTANGVTYAVNGTAKSRKKYRPIEEIWIDSPKGRGLKKDISPILDNGLKLCR